MALTRAEKVEIIQLREEKLRREEWNRVIPKLAFLYEPMRYKVARGGRGSGKSWEFARALLKMGSKRTLRILCTREVQKTIKDSVHKLLSDQIKKLSLGNHYDILNNEIRGMNGTLFIFAGLSDQTAESIKSYEGIDITWIEEAQAVTKRSWDILIPTIRKDDSEIWVSYNPELDTDETHIRFAVDPPANCISVLVNYSDNPWFNSVLELERLRCKVMDPKGYDNIWEGKCKPAVTGAIYYEEVVKAEATGQICNVPYDPLLKVHAVFDLGWNDAMAICLVQALRSEIRIIEYVEDSHKTLDHYSAELKKLNLNWGKLFLPHDGKARDYRTGQSAQEIMEKLGWQVEITEDIGLEDGIKLVRMNFGRIYFDKVKAGQLVQCVKRYRRAINNQTNEPLGPLHDSFSHGCDALRYVVVNADRFSNTDRKKPDMSRVFRR